MGGSAELFVQPSGLSFGAGLAAGQWGRGIPVLGGFPAPAAPTGVASCKDLAASSPPTLLEEYEIYSLSIGWGVLATHAGGWAAPPNLSAELSLLVNDRIRYTQEDTELASLQDVAANAYLTAGAWSADLVNPLRVGPRDRLSLRAGVRADEVSSAISIVVGAQMYAPGGVATAIGFESSISYRVLDMPASRRL